MLDSVVKLALVDDVESGRVAGDVLGRYDLDFGWHFVSEPTVVTKTAGYGRYSPPGEDSLALADTMRRFLSGTTAAEKKPSGGTTRQDTNTTSYFDFGLAVFHGF